MKNPQRHMLRKGTGYSPEDIFSLMPDDSDRKILRKYRVDLDGDRVNVSSLRLRTFRKSGCVCVVCGIKGQVFHKEKHGPNIPTYHLNLYAFDESGEEVLMTKDHILPKSLDGADKLSNMQTMCYHCNQKKGNTYG